MRLAVTDGVTVGGLVVSGKIVAVDTLDRVVGGEDAIAGNEQATSVAEY